MPRIPDETVVVFVDRDGRKARSTDGRIGWSGEPLLLRAVLPRTAPPTASASTSIGIGGGAGGVFGGRGGRRNLESPPTAVLYVRVLRRGDGGYGRAWTGMGVCVWE